MNDLNNNILLLTDSYKIGHAVQYPPGTENVYSYFESRGGAYPATVFFGLQYLLDRYLSKPIEPWMIHQAKKLLDEHFGGPMMNLAGWERLLFKHQGFLPIRIKAVPEGTLVPTHNVLMTVENTDPEFFWLTNYLETLLSQVWYPTTVATISYHVRQKILSYLEMTGDPSQIDFKLHDFGERGVSSMESAAIGGAAHLTSFMGTDTLPALMLLLRYYQGGIAGYSVPASEHSTMTSWGGPDKEVEAFENMITQYGDYPIYSVVSDSYDIYNACKNLWGSDLREKVLAANGKLVVRPDSGDPPKVCVELLEILWEQFGGTTNDKGYKVLNPKVGIIWGDGLEPDIIERILFRMKLHNWSADNIVFGMGGGLLQKVNRDTQRFAFKCSSVVVNGEERDVFKRPVGDAMKNSKRGRLGLYYNTDDGYATDREGYAFDNLETVYENGHIVKRTTLDEVRGRTGVIHPEALVA